MFSKPHISLNDTPHGDWRSMTATEMLKNSDEWHILCIFKCEDQVF